MPLSLPIDSSALPSIQTQTSIGGNAEPYSRVVLLPNPQSLSPSEIVFVRVRSGRGARSIRHTPRQTVQVAYLLACLCYVASNYHRRKTKLRNFSSHTVNQYFQPVECVRAMTMCDFLTDCLQRGMLFLSKYSAACASVVPLKRDEARATPSASAMLAPLPAKGLRGEMDVSVCVFQRCGKSAELQRLIDELTSLHGYYRR